MPVFQIGLDDGRSLRIEADDQASALAGVQHFQEHEKPSGAVAGLEHGISSAASGISSTLGLAGVKSDTLDDVAKKTAPEDYKAASLIREGGHWYNPKDYQPSALPQVLAEQAPGFGVDMAAGKAGAMAGSKIAGPRGAVVGGIGAWLASGALRTFGPGAHENAKARTGDANAPVTTPDLVREGLKQAAVAVPNAIGLGRVIPGIGGKVAGVGLSGTGEALRKYGTTIGTEALTGGAADALDQASTNIGQEHAAPFDANRAASAAVTRGAGGALVAAPKLAGESLAAAKYREFGGDNAQAAIDLANRHMEHADGEKLIGTFGGTKKAADVVHAAHSDVMGELRKASSEDGTELSQNNQNTLDRVQSGGKASEREVSALSDEASPELTSLVRQALLSRKLKSMGTLTDDKFTGGLSGAMERLRPISNPVGTGVAALATGIAGHAGGLGMLGTFAPHVLGGIAGTYGVSRLFDKMTGARSPVQGFTDKFATGEAPNRIAPPIVAPEAPDTHNPSAGPWGARLAEASATGPSVAAPPMNPEAAPQSLRSLLNSNVKVDEGIGGIVKKIQDAKRKDMIAQSRPALAQLAAQSKPAPVVPETAPAPPPISPMAVKMLQKNLKAGLPPEPAPIVPAPAPVPEAPTFNPTALSMLHKRLKAGLPTEPVIEPAKPIELPAKFAGTLKKDPAELPAGFSSLLGRTMPKTETGAAAQVSESPASEAISTLMAKLRSQSAPPQAQPAPVAPTPAPAVTPTAPVMPAPSLLPKITKITKKAKGKVVEQAAEPVKTSDEHMDPDTGELFSYKPLTPEELHGRHMTHEDFAAHETAEKLKSGELQSEKAQEYHDGVVRDRMKREHELQVLSESATTPDDVPVAKLLLQELHHIRRGATAENAIKYAGIHMSAKMRAASRQLMSGPFHKMWSKYD